MQTAKILVLGVIGLVGCAPSAKTASTTTMTAADVSSSPSSASSSSLPEDLPTSREATPAAAASKGEELPGEIVCRTSNRDTGTTELRLEWKGSEATGTIRTVAPSGETTTQRIQAERYRGMIVIDDPNNVDLAVHAAIVAPSNGKQAMRVGSGMFATCE
jgi:hypothetical protein